MKKHNTNAKPSKKITRRNTVTATYSMPPDLKEFIESMAVKTNRSASNWVVDALLALRASLKQSPNS